jgi:aryl-alcohol dehydrogenase-like predicted oxidoreductase
MRYRQLGQTGVFVSRICLGAMTFGGRTIPPFDVVGGLDLDQAKCLVDAALDAGVNFIDTANVYSAGESEALLGEALRGRRRDVVLATKFQSRMGAGPNNVGQSRLHMMEALEDSLRRLRTDHIDLYQIHSFDPLTPLEETLRALDDAVRQGKVRYVGCSNLAAWQVTKALGISALRDLSTFVSVQAYYSLAGRDIESELIPMIEDQKLGLMVWSPLAGGFLSGKFDRHGSTDQGARRVKLEFPPINPGRDYDIVDVLKSVAARRQVSAARIALAWVLSQPVVTSVIVGAKRIDQLEDNLAALDLELTAEDLAELDEVSKPQLSYPGWIQAWGASSRLPQISQA